MDHSEGLILLTRCVKEMGEQAAMENFSTALAWHGEAQRALRDVQVSLLEQQFRQKQRQAQTNEGHTA
jgi:hypothetical protein